LLVMFTKVKNIQFLPHGRQGYPFQILIAIWTIQRLL